MADGSKTKMIPQVEGDIKQFFWGTCIIIVAHTNRKWEHKNLSGLLFRDGLVVILRRSSGDPSSDPALIQR